MRRLAALALLALSLSYAPASASSTPSHGVAAHPPFASYWAGFVDHWSGLLKKQNGVILVVLGVGAVSLFIITRGKWLKN